MKASPLARAAHQLVELALPLIITPQLRAWLVEQRRSGTPRARIIGELFRQPDPQLGFLFGPVTMGMLLSVPMIAIGAAVIARALVRPAYPPTSPSTATDAR